MAMASSTKNLIDTLALIADQNHLKAKKNTIENSPTIPRPRPACYLPPSIASANCYSHKKIRSPPPSPKPEVSQSPSPPPPPLPPSPKPEVSQSPSPSPPPASAPPPRQPFRKQKPIESFESVSKIIKFELTDEEKQRLSEKIATVLKKFSVDDTQELMPLLLAEKEIQQAVVDEIVRFLSSEKRMEIAR